MKCALCGHEFNENDAGTSCHGCAMSSGCHQIRCPNCGYETPKEPKLIQVLRSWSKKKDGAKRTS